MVFDGNDIRVTRHYGATPYTIAFFAHFFASPSLRREWGRQFAEKYAIDAVFFSVSHNHWWNTREFAPAVAAAKSTSKQRVIGYGVSMGGTGALLAFTEAIAISPQASVNPAVVPWETRWRKERAELTFMRAPAKSRGRSTVILDPTFELDAKHADLIGGPRIEFPGLGHTLANRLAEQKQLASLIFDLAERRGS